MWTTSHSSRRRHPSARLPPSAPGSRSPGQYPELRPTGAPARRIPKAANASRMTPPTSQPADADFRSKLWNPPPPGLPSPGRSATGLGATQAVRTDACRLGSPPANIAQELAQPYPTPAQPRAGQPHEHPSRIPATAEPRHRYAPQQHRPNDGLDPQPRRTPSAGRQFPVSRSRLLPGVQLRRRMRQPGHPTGAVSQHQRPTPNGSRPGAGRRRPDHS